MDYKKLATFITLIVLIISNLFMLFGQDILGDFIIVATMMVIISGLILIVLVIISRQDILKPKNEITNNAFDFEEKAKTKTCNICNTENKEKAISCIKCGSSLIDVTCPICNTVNSFDQKYCKSCDTILQNKKRH